MEQETEGNRERKRKEIEREGWEEGKGTFHFFIDLQVRTNIVVYTGRKSIRTYSVLLIGYRIHCSPWKIAHLRSFQMP